ncbi:Acyl-coenzyme A thioesterase 3 [Oryzias melastigma]|uniref:Acyl-coenzyme A thioesterase 3 n=1 Tax=Oryzias melastigma TaxID=30732 RepID=A0A834C0C6_ORYME|nr:Acyl-coenzyme A thioesterase 3 [Oryzias melastigma]
MSSQVRLRLLPSDICLYDEPIQVKVSHLRSRQVVTIKASSTDEKGVLFSSSATYRADGNGDIDLVRDASLSGSYVGVEPMGLLRTLKPNTLNTLFIKEKALEPHMVKFSVHDEEEQDQILAEAINERLLMADGVSRVSVKEGSFHGVLFTPPGTGPFPAVLDLCTIMSERRAALLANKGFVVLTLSVFQEKLGNLKMLHLDPLEEAIIFLLQQPKVGSKRISIISNSKSADVALSLAAFVPGVEAVVWISGCSANTALPLFYKKRQILPALMFDAKKVIPTQSGAVIGKYAMHDPLKEENRASVVPIEQANAHFLFVAPEDDLCWDSYTYMMEMMERLQHLGKTNFESVCYPKAGHFLEPPYGPFCPSSLNMFLKKPVLWGGESRTHAAAEVDMWKKIQEFLKSHVSCDPVQTDAKL